MITGEGKAEPVDFDSLFAKAEGAARMLCMTGDPVFRRHLADLAKGREAVTTLENNVTTLAEALKDALDFVQHYSYLWDSTSESTLKHPQLIGDNSIAALKAAGEWL